MIYVLFFYSDFHFLKTASLPEVILKNLPSGKLDGVQLLVPVTLPKIIHFRKPWVNLSALKKIEKKVYIQGSHQLSHPSNMSLFFAIPIPESFRKNLNLRTSNDQPLLHAQPLFLYISLLKVPKGISSLSFLLCSSLFLCTTHLLSLIP